MDGEEVSDNDHLNGLDSKISDRGFFERILKEFKETLAARDARLDERFEGQKEAITKAEQRLDVMLAGFPQEYAKRLELEQMKATADTTAKALEQKVADSAKALAEANDKTEERTNVRLKKMEDYQSRLTGIAITFPIISGIVVFLLTRKTQ